MKDYTQEQLLARDVEQVYRSFVYMPNEHSYTVSTLWVLHTHLRTSDGVFLPYITPRLYFGSKLAGCGKSLATELTVRMSYNGEMVLEPTPPSVTTLMNQDHSTLGFDEIDTYFGRGTGRGSMRAILNGGYKAGSFVTRQRGDEVEKLNSHGPICLNGKNAGLFMGSEKFETLRSRSIAIILEQKPADHYAHRYNPETHDARLRGLMRGLKQWGQSNARKVLAIPVEGLMPVKIANRAEEIWTVLFRLAQHLGDDWPERVEAAARALVLGEWEDDDQPYVSPSEELLAAVRATFREDEEFLSTSTILERLEGSEEPPSLMDEWFTERAAEMGLASGLRVYGVEPTRRRLTGPAERGYCRGALGMEPVAKELEPAFATFGWSSEESGAA